MRPPSIERLLPAAYQRAAVPGSPLATLLEIMADLHAPDEALLENVEDLFDPYRTGDDLVGFLAGWVALDVVRSGGPSAGPAAGSVAGPPIGRLRDLVAEGSLLAQWRGTRIGLRRYLEVATGVPGFAVDEPRRPRFHFVVTVPAAAADQLDLVRRIVDHEKPAATTCRIRLADEEQPS